MATNEGRNGMADRGDTISNPITINVAAKDR